VKFEPTQQDLLIMDNIYNRVMMGLQRVFLIVMTSISYVFYLLLPVFLSLFYIITFNINYIIKLINFIKYNQINNDNG